MASAIPFFSFPCKLFRDTAAIAMWKPAFLLVLGMFAVPWSQTPQELVQDAISKQRAGDLAGAVQQYRQFLKLHPEATAIHSNLGAALAGLGRFENAIAEYRIALKQSPSFPGARLNLALAYYKMGQIEDAARELTRVHAEDPANSQATLLLADCHLRMGQDNDVIRILEPEEKKHPDDLAIAYMLGTAYIHNKQVEPGEILVDRILRNGDSAEAHLMMGSAKMNIADFAGARDEFAKAVALNPNLPQVHVLYAQALHFTGDSDLSLAQYQEELKIDPYSFEANLQIGATLRRSRNTTRPSSISLVRLKPGPAIQRCAISWRESLSIRTGPTMQGANWNLWSRSRLNLPRPMSHYPSRITGSSALRTGKESER